MLQYSARDIMSNVWPTATNKLEMWSAPADSGRNTTYVPHSRQNGPPISKMVEYRTTRHDQLHDIMIW